MLKFRGSGIKFYTPTIESLPQTDVENDTICVVSDPIDGGLFAYDDTKLYVNNGVDTFNGWVRIGDQNLITSLLELNDNIYVGSNKVLMVEEIDLNNNDIIFNGEIGTIKFI